MRVSHAECLRVGMQLWSDMRKRNQRSQYTVEAKRARREQEKVQKKKACCGESS